MGLPSSAQPQDSSSRGWPLRGGARPAPGRSVGRLRALPGDTSCAARGARLRRRLRPRPESGSRPPGIPHPIGPGRLGAWPSPPDPSTGPRPEFVTLQLVFVFVLPWS